MKKLATAAIAAIVGLAPILGATTTASAGGRDYHNKHRPYYGGNNRGTNWSGVGAGLAAGAALGLGAGLLINRPPPRVYYAPPPPPRPPVVYYAAPAPAYYPPPPPPVYYDRGWTEAHVEWCLNRYRSYNPATNTYTGYDGYQHECRGPY